ELRIQNWQASKTNTIYVSYETHPPPSTAGTYIRARRKSPAALLAEIEQAVKQSPAQRALLIFDTLYPLCTLPSPFNLSTYLSTLISLAANLSLVAVYHLDIPIPRLPHYEAPHTDADVYAPLPLTVLRYLATTILTTHSVSHLLAKKRARERSLPEPVFGMEEELEGVIVGLPVVDAGAPGMVVEMEHRRKSGRSMGDHAKIFVPTAPEFAPEKAVMLEDHALFRKPDQKEDDRVEDEGQMPPTFDLGLTERQRRARDGVVLPYFDAQKAEGGGGGGRILYEMGAEDDFDEEEDEI
ncbi:MAG: hypothetical protein Q9191_005611, partial [Dirinaria sp. TL-2023a]